MPDPLESSRILPIVEKGKKEVDERKIFQDKVTTMSMREMMGCIICLLLIRTNNSEVMCGFRHYVN
jgi:hypothetical protein